MGMRRRGSGFSLIEMMVVVAIVAVVGALAVPAVGRWSEDQRVKGAARGVADAFLLARAEAIRTGSNHLVVLGAAMGVASSTVRTALGVESPVVITDPIAIVDDGPPGTADCNVAANEVRHRMGAVQGVLWGTTGSLAGSTPAPDDPGGATGSIATLGTSFTDASNPAGNASWVLFQPDGLPRLFTPKSGDCDAVGLVGQGGGAIYLTNGRRDYAVVLGPLGTARVHVWDQGAGAWRQ